MKRAAHVLGALAVAGLAPAAVHAGGPITGEWTENFDGYTDGVDIVGTGGWEHWDDLPTSPGGRVTSDVSLSAPHSVQITGGAAPDDVIRQFNITSGIWDLTAWQFIPADATGGDTTGTGFIMLNQYDHGCATCNWSVQIVVDVNANEIRSEFRPDAITLPYPKGQWNEIRVRVNLDSDSMEAFFNGELFDSGLWTDGSFASGEGILELACLDLFGWDGPFATYYDDITFTEVPPIGACCLPADGSCPGEEFSIEDCDAMAGIFQGFGSSCAASTCYQDTEDGWIVEAPLTWDASTAHADTCDETDDCMLSASPDLQWVVSVPRDREWVFSACDASFDSVLSLGSTPCSFDIAQEDDSAGCGVASEIREFLTVDGGPYYLTLEGFSSGACGPFTLDFREICPLLADNPKALDEGEPCGDDLNGGCNSDVPAYTSIECGDVYRGTGFQDGGTRDTDWYELVLTETTTITIEGDSETAGYVMGLIQYTEGLEGSGNCDDISGFIVPADQTNPCFEESASAVAADLPVDLGGIYWVFAAPSFAFDIIDCGDHDVYELRLTCGEGEPCTSDIDMSGVVGFSDLVTILSNWGPCPGCPADLDGSGVVGFSDLVQVLADWGPCP